MKIIRTRTVNAKPVIDDTFFKCRRRRTVFSFSKKAARFWKFI